MEGPVAPARGPSCVRARRRPPACNPSAVAPGCTFSTRCRFAREQCRMEEPTLRDIGPMEAEHRIACHFAEQLSDDVTLEARV